MSNLTRETVIDWIFDQHGKIFSIKFVKRTTGEVRHMVCRMGVKKFLKGGVLPYDPAEKMLLPVFDLQKQDYRCISVDTIVSVKIRGKWCKVRS